MAAAGFGRGIIALSTVRNSINRAWRNEAQAKLNNFGKNNPNYSVELNNTINSRGLSEQARQNMANRSPIEIPKDATIKAEIKKSGYAQIKYTWKENGIKYESRWHTKTPGAPESQGNTWVVQKVVPGNSTGQRRQEFVKIKDHGWIPMKEWKDASTARQNGTATQRQTEILNKGHWKDK